MRPVRSFFAMLSTYRSGLSSTICAQTACANAFASGQRTLLRFAGASGVTTCSPLPPVVLQNVAKPSDSSRSLSSRAAAITASNESSGLGSRSKTRRPGTSGWSGAPHRTRQPSDAIDLQIRLVVAGDPRQRQQVRSSFHGVTLEKALPVDAVRRANDRAGASLDVPHQPLADALEVAGEIELGDGLAVGGVRPQRLVGLGDRYAHHDVGFVARSRTTRRAACLAYTLRRRLFHCCFLRVGGSLGDDLTRRLLLTQPLESSLAHVPRACPAREFDLGDQLRLDPLHVATAARCVRTGKRTLV